MNAKTKAFLVTAGACAVGVIVAGYALKMLGDLPFLKEAKDGLGG